MLAFPRRKTRAPRPWAPDEIELEPWMRNRLEYLRRHGDPAKQALYAVEKRQMEQAQLRRMRVRL